MDVFELRNNVIADYGSYVGSFLTIRDAAIRAHVAQQLEDGFLWPQPLVQLNPSFEPGEPLRRLVDEGVLHQECLKIFSAKGPGETGAPIQLYRHQVEGIHAARAGENYVLTTGTGSGKSLSYIVPIVEHVLRRGSGQGIQAIVVYPMNALANSQIGELEKFLCRGYPEGRPPVTFRSYTGQEKDAERAEIIANPPDILLTNYVMLELVLTRRGEDRLVRAAKGLRFLVLDELHTYRGRQGADVALLVRRVREACEATKLVHIGTSATMSSEGSWPEQQEEVARVASNLFGAEVHPKRIIGETLRRATQAPEQGDAGFFQRLRELIAAGDEPPEGDTARFLAHPLAAWIESTLGVVPDPGSGRLVRCKPLPLSMTEDSAAALLARDAGLSLDVADGALRRALLAGYRCRDAHGRPIFAFRLHQFLSKGESVYAGLGPADARYITLQAQQFEPNCDRARVLLPVAFCRECGQEYYVVRRGRGEDGRIRYTQRGLSERADEAEGEPGFLHVDLANPWPDPQDHAAVVNRLPESWIDVVDGRRVVRKSLQQRVPRQVFLSPLGVEGAGGLRAHYMEAPFLFCMWCGVTYDAHHTSDFGKLATLGSEGRSTATTVLSLSTVRRLRDDRTLEREARKLLSFTDNRQDASLQAGHFNDFVEIGLIRSALMRAVAAEGASGLRHDQLTARVFDALALPIELYAQNPMVEYVQRDETDRALRQAIGYYLYRDLRRGWRITSPNLEQCGLLDIDYVSLDRFAADEVRWKRLHPALAGASTAERLRVCRVLLDFMRRELAIRVDYLDPVAQEGIRQLSAQYLVEPWSLDEQERLERGRIVFPASRRSERPAAAHLVYLSPLGGFGRYLKRATTFASLSRPLKGDDVEQILPELLEALTIPGLVHKVMDKRDADDVPGYQLNASALVWKPGDGTRAFHDPVRVPNVPDDGLRTNPFFSAFYRDDTSDLKALEAREHTAQVPMEQRKLREEKFRAASLPILYCSPTMELGVDIRQLNVVNLRNVPPTPANYAQRSGRAGRSGQPAFVFTYCSSGSPHDQYFFKRPEKMVAGAVSPPRLDLQNEDLLRAHVHAVWLGVSRLDLGKSLAEVLDVNGDSPTLDLLPKVRDALDYPEHRERARILVKAALGDEVARLVGEGGASDEWIDRVLRELPHSFEMACERWRGLYRAALSQQEHHTRTIRDASRDVRDRDAAKRLRDEAEAQLRLLVERGSSSQSDFYSYRYFASEGFLPGYNFPRLPLSAYLAGRKRQKGVDEFLTRPRFLAISEFGPRSIIYHEGSRYVVNKVILPIDGEGGALKRRAALCETCGYLHPIEDRAGSDLCERCESPLRRVWDNLFRMQNVSTRRRDRINSDEEERVRIGYEIKTGVRFVRRGGVLSAQLATLTGEDGTPLARLHYGHAATIWRMNLGWRRRKHDVIGYQLDVERGLWARSEQPSAEEDGEENLSRRIERVVPYVEDHRNCLLIEPAEPLDAPVMASLESALKAAIQVHFQLEDRELAAEPLPDDRERRLMLFYESSEGGAGVLRRLVEDRRALRQVARIALDLCHFDPYTLEDRRRAPRGREDCEAACYDCLLSYFNQREHRELDRKLLPGLLHRWMTGEINTSPGPRPREEQVSELLRLADSELERRWLRMVEQMGLLLPSDAQPLMESCRVRPDFLYRQQGVAVFVDGPPHDTPAQRAKDSEQQEALEDAGLTVIRFHHTADWEAILKRYPSIFGRPTAPSDVPPPPSPPKATAAPEQRYNPEMFEDQWHPLLDALSAIDGVEVEPGEDVMRAGRVIDQYVAKLTRAGQMVFLVDASTKTAADVAAALEAKGLRVVRVRAGDQGLTDRVLASLER